MATRLHAIAKFRGQCWDQFPLRACGPDPRQGRGLGVGPDPLVSKVPFKALEGLPLKPP